MPKKMKLEGLKIQSFVTSLTEKKKSQLKGGLVWESCPSCPDVCGTEQCTAIEGCSGDQSNVVMCNSMPKPC